MKKILLSVMLTSSILATHGAQRHGKLEVICGPMFAGKSEKLISLVDRAHYAQQTVLVVKPILDTRSASNTINSHRGSTYTAHAINTPQELLDLVAQGHPTQGEYTVIAIEGYSDPIIMIGAEESYQPRCKQCYSIES